MSTKQETAENRFAYAKVRYKGRIYWWVGYTDSRRELVPVRTKDGKRVLLAFRDGSKTFWADRNMVEVIKVYQRPNTIKHLNEYASAARKGKVCPRCGGIDCNRFRSCYMCGCGRCDGAYGGLCDLD